MIINYKKKGFQTIPKLEICLTDASSSNQITWKIMHESNDWMTLSVTCKRISINHCIISVTDQPYCVQNHKTCKSSLGDMPEAIKDDRFVHECLIKFFNET